MIRRRTFKGLRASDAARAMRHNSASIVTAAIQRASPSDEKIQAIWALWSTRGPRVLRTLGAA